MIKLLSISVFAAFLAACSSMSGMHSSMAGSADTQHSSDSAAAKHGNPAAVSPGGGGGTQ